ncbi:PIG-L family deacetylase [Bryobacter aggregatus]|uniref:PIG-L family deacetylase n=1 Tax=Bryobacter aggregatus TaxID=360054 RepID=UPI0004E18745|nr:PIG-L family deacetylase [Bryobacter aggregatus]
MRSAVLLLVLAIALPSQRTFSGAPEVKQALDKLTVVGSVMMIAAHPDDENTGVIAYYARGKKVRTAYLALNRGEGGQNLIGSDQGVDIGVIRTQELLAARRIDGGEQFFTRAIDFGFSKSAKETLDFWGKEKVLGDVVWAIRKFRPDVIIRRFSGTPSDGHGHHQASALLADEAFGAAADPKRFPEQLQYVEPWQAKRLVWNAFGPGGPPEPAGAASAARVSIDMGEFDPYLGYSYGEIAGWSRSQHRSQAMGAAERKGSQPTYFINIKGDPASKDLFDGIDTTWNRIPGGTKIGELLTRASKEYHPAKPTAILPYLLEARALLAPKKDYYSTIKLHDLDEAIALVAGLWVEFQADKYVAVQGTTSKMKLAAIERNDATITLQSASFRGATGVAPFSKETKLVDNTMLSIPLDWNLSQDAALTQPYYLIEPRTESSFTVNDRSVLGLPQGPAPVVATIKFLVNGTEIELTRGVTHRYVDRSAGELTRPVTIVAPISVRLTEDALVFPAAEARKVEVVLKANQPNRKGSLKLNVPAGWKTDPATLDFNIAAADEEKTLSFVVTPPREASLASVTAVATIDGREYTHGTHVIQYSHIPPQTLAPLAKSKLVRFDAKVLSKRIGYIMGAGDEVPDALRQLGCEVILLSDTDLTTGRLGQFDAIVTGVRAYNTRPDLRANAQRIFDDYVAKGGTFIVQYNVVEGGFFGGDPSILSKVGPYPITTSRDRVTDEHAAVQFPKVDQRLLQFPNQIGEKDFDGWVQERGLYFANKWDDHYQPLFSMHDPGENPMLGGTLVTKYGQGNYIFTPMSWFRQLPAGVPGAYRIFANFLSAGKN